MRHYFISESHTKDDYFTFNEVVQGISFSFDSCNDVFSKNQVDYGSKVLIDAVVKHKDRYFGSVLDMGCGYGTLSIVLSKCLLDCNFTMCDINSTAVELANKNRIRNKCNNIVDVFESDLFSNIDSTFDHIISNPPIKTGKSVLVNLITEGYEKLNNGGSMTLVIKKNYGADSAKKLMETLFGNSEILSRDKGFYILYSKKVG